MRSTQFGTMKGLVTMIKKLLARPLFLVAFTLGVASVYAQEFSQPIPAAQKPYLKDYATPTDQIRAGFTPYKAQLVWGEPLLVTFSVENLAPNSFEFTFGGDYRGTGRHDRYKITVTDANGQTLPDPIANPMDFGGVLQTQKLKQGQIFTNILGLAAFRVIEKPGVYTVNCRFALDDRFPQKENDLVVATTFTLAILERTPERVARVLDELAAKAQDARSGDIPEAFALIARFGKDDAVPRLAGLAQEGPLERRTAALRALGLLSTDAAVDTALTGLKDPEPAIRSAAAGALGKMKNPRAVNALLSSLRSEKPEVAEAVLLALGDARSDRAFAVITNVLETGAIEMQRAAVKALVNYGGTNAAATLTQHVNTNFLALRYDIVLALSEKLRQPIDAEWLLPVLLQREQNHEWLDTLRLLRLYGGDKAIPTLLSGLDFDAAWSGRNWWILNEVRAIRNGPAADYAYDPNNDGTAEQRENNLRILQALKPLAGPIPSLPAPAPAAPVPYLKTDPPIDFTPSFQDILGGVQIKSGFLALNQRRNGSDFPYKVSADYTEVYRQSARFRALPGDPQRCADLKITPEQLTQLTSALRDFAVTLSGTNASNYRLEFAQQKIGNLYTLLTNIPDHPPHHDDWHALHKDYEEAPSAYKEQAKAALIDSVRIFSQNYHAGTVAFVEAATRIFTHDQLEQILR